MYKPNVETVEHRRLLAGDLALEEPTSLEVGSTPWALAAGDLNGDGNVDVAVANFGGPGVREDVSVVLGRGDGTFEDEIRYPIGAGAKPGSIAVADVNNDGHLDIIVGNVSDKGVSVLLNLGDGTYPSDPTSYAVVGNTSDIQVADLDGDGTLDIVASVWVGTVYLLRGNGDGTFEGATWIGGVGIGEGTGPFLSSLAVGDLDADNDLDIAFANNDDDGVSILRQTDDTTFVEEEMIRLPFNAAPHSIVIDDIDMDGNLDLLTANHGSPKVSVIFGRADGTFQESWEFEGGHRPMDITVVDLDMDGDRDMVAINPYRTTVSILLNEGNRQFGFPLTVDLPKDLWSNTVISADLDQDGVPDLIATNNGCCAPGIAIVMNSTEPPLPGDANLDGAVNFEDFVTLSTNFGLTGAHRRDGDFNSNGIVDFGDFVILSNNFRRDLQNETASEPDDFADQSLDFASTGSLSTRHKTDISDVVALDILFERWRKAEV